MVDRSQPNGRGQKRARGGVECALVHCGDVFFTLNTSLLITMLEYSKPLSIMIIRRIIIVISDNLNTETVSHSSEKNINF
jgi:hypothetical protein